MSEPTEDRPAVDEFGEPDRPAAAGTVTNLVTAAVVLALGAAALAGALSLGVGEPASPGAGTWPMLIGGALIALGVVLALRARRTTDAERFNRSGLLVLIAVASMVGYVAVIGSIGFEIPTALLAFVWLRFLGRERLLTSIIGGLAMVAAFYLLFIGALNVSIPHLF
ncbi:tripartite tricarboxylate transporter TctB family protein [Phytomonospora sp. NPDC050363]|uniref:tripartite tricarboxylate transporter TctB family protein n=1 Tax=Phytomonospora sp. NPDC050363 TaxID=3155642 RepID=UPI0033ED4D8B